METLVLHRFVLQSHLTVTMHLGFRGQSDSMFYANFPIIMLTSGRHRPQHQLRAPRPGPPNLSWESTWLWRPLPATEGSRKCGRQVTVCPPSFQQVGMAHLFGKPCVFSHHQPRGQHLPSKGVTSPPNSLFLPQQAGRGGSCRLPGHGPIPGGENMV